MDYKIAVICVYFGKLPSYWDFVHKTILYNPSIDMLLFTDSEFWTTESNFKVIPLTMAEFEKRAASILGFPLKFNRPYKCCDYKPAYGLIFEDALDGYDFWAFADADVLWGDFEKFLSRWVTHYDIISTHGGRINGPLTFFRNSPNCNHLIFEVPDLNCKLVSDQYAGIDERDLDKLLKSRKDIRYCRKEVGLREAAFWRNGKLYEASTMEEKMIFHLHRPLLSAKKLIVDVNSESVRHL